MGVCISVWRQCIGLFSVSFRADGCSTARSTGVCNAPLRTACVLSIQLLLAGIESYASLRLACVLSLLLLLAGIERNPGPTRYEDIMRHLDAIVTELRDTRATLCNKIDDSIKDLSAKIQNCEQHLAILSTRLDTADQERSAMKADIDNLKAQVGLLKLSTDTANLPAQAVAAHPAHPAPSANISEVVHELNLRTSKQANIVITGLQPCITDDITLVQNLLSNELNITTTVSSCTRLGNPNHRGPQLLLATLASATDAKNILRHAKDLRNSSSDNIRDHVYINPDLTQQQRITQYKLRAEIRRRTAAGESNLIIRNERIITKPSTSVSSASDQVLMRQMYDSLTELCRTNHLTLGLSTSPPPTIT